jgi:hypothetical protein
MTPSANNIGELKMREFALCLSQFDPNSLSPFVLTDHSYGSMIPTKNMSPGAHNDAEP